MMSEFKDSFTVTKHRVQKKTEAFMSRRPKLRYGILGAAVILILADIVMIVKPFIVEAPYDLGKAAVLLPEANATIANAITFDEKESTYSYATAADANGATKGIKASFNTDIQKGISVTDNLNSVDFAMKASEKHNQGRKSDNRIVYPLTSNDGWAVYTIQTTGVKEDIILTKSNDDKRTFSYDLKLNDSMEPRIESDGGLGIYGNTLLSGSITAASESDTALLEKMRKNASKDTLLFKIPAPIVVEANGNESEFAHATFKLDGNKMSIVTTGLKRANFPLSIDPSIYVTSATEFMAGNNETNIDFNVTDQLIQKAPTTGARFDQWQDTLSLPVATSANGVAAAGGFIYSVGGGCRNIYRSGWRHQSCRKNMGCRWSWWWRWIDNRRRWSWWWRWICHRNCSRYAPRSP
jgi:hypothetical protein